MGDKNTETTKRTRKDNGSGTIFYNEKRDRWEAEIHWMSSSGEKMNKKFSGKKKSVVKSKLDEFKKQLIISSGDIEKKGITFKDYADSWLENKLKNSLKPTSYLRKEVTLRCQVYPIIGGIPIDEIESSDIQSMVNDLVSDGKSYSTIKKAFEAVNGCLRSYRIDNKKSSGHNPCEGVVLPTAKKKDPSDIIFYNEEERQKIKTEATRVYKNGKSVYRLGEAIIVLMYTGLRIGELLALTWDDIDFDKKTISVEVDVGVIVHCQRG